MPSPPPPRSTILIAGATGNTGLSVVSTLSSALSTSTTAAHTYRILALSRNPESDTARKLMKMEGVEVEKGDWAAVTKEWLLERGVRRAFIASHNTPSHFAAESSFHLALLHAHVQYVVRISTSAPNVTPDHPTYYARAHWAIETLLGSRPFVDGGLAWTSLQPNIFVPFVMAPAVAWVERRKGGKEEDEDKEDGDEEPLCLLADEHAPVAYIDPRDVGRFAALLLLEPDPAPHDGQRYILNGPADVTGRQIVELVEQRLWGGKRKVRDVRFRDLGFVDRMVEGAAAMGVEEEERRLLLSIKRAPETAWAGECSMVSTSGVVGEMLGEERGTLEGWFEEQVGGKKGSAETH